MLDQLVKRLDRQGCQEYQEGYQRELDLTNRRLERLRNKQKKNPNFEAYDYYANEKVSIVTRIEEWEAVKDELEWILEIIQERLSALDVRERYPESKQVGKDAHQLSLGIK
ncbi:hypothetical protein MUP77_14950 [Candidatus Bathyarchaeota archaeon]|nr:hypothetical protein [Candidatus Bathyarchaeota archaeon]